MTAEDVDYCRGKGIVYVVNDGYRLAPWADVLYAADGPTSSGDWWGHHIKEINNDFSGEKWTVDFQAALRYGLNHVGISNEDWSDQYGIVARGGNSGFQALNLSILKEAPERVILLGYDMKAAPCGKRHWFGDHPGALNRDSNYKKWVGSFNNAAPLINVPVINCTIETALECFPRKSLRDVL